MFEWQDRNVFVTGCTGFLGWWLTKELVARGARVTALVRDLVPEAPFYLAGLDRQVTMVHGRLEDGDVLQRAINEYEIDTVYHLAAQAIVGAANRNPISTFEANIQGTWNLLEACRQTDTVRRIVVASSDKAYGDHDQLPYEENFALQGRHPYDVSKSCADLIAHSYHETYGLPVCVTRCGNLFGPGDLHFNRLVPGTFRAIFRNQRPVIRSDGSPLRDYVFVGDIVEGYLALAERMDNDDIVGKSFNFGTGRPLSVLELTTAMLAVSGRDDLEPDVQNTARGEIRHQYLSSDRAKTDLDWAPGASVEERLRETHDWYREHLDRLIV